MRACRMCVGFASRSRPAIGQLATLVAKLVEADQLRVSRLLEDCRAKILDEETLLSDRVLHRVDPLLESVTNLNDRNEYQAACLRPQPRGAPRVVGWRSHRYGGFRPERTVRAASLGGLVQALGATADSWQVACLNGDDLRPDLEEPLVQGDVVSLRRVKIRS